MLGLWTILQSYVVPIITDKTDLKETKSQEPSDVSECVQTFGSGTTLNRRVKTAFSWPKKGKPTFSSVVSK